MYKRNFGKKKQVHFASENEYYELLGYLAKSNGTTSIVWEPNKDQGAWGNEGRIHIYINDFPFANNCDLKAGNGNITNRVNCNEFFVNITTYHNFIEGKTQNIDDIRDTVPAEYRPDFDHGLNL
ncbi:MAG: hypothetical protein FVQ80_15650 [Planctomycetes bacterium]|nr:hypothetical protein [Planctomycetota bacterium]